MPGSYCQYCDHRCFVERIDPNTGRHWHLATCDAGAARDRESLGVDYSTAINPYTDLIAQQESVGDASTEETDDRA